jgi:heme A synthase
MVNSTAKIENRQIGGSEERLTMTQKGLARYAWAVLFYNVGVILWGAFVRATGSGAGCGNHWPLCNGQVIPRAPQLETVIEFLHRASSGLSLLLIAGLVVWAWRAYPKGHRVRLGAGLAGFFIITEALLGAGLVLLAWVAGNASLGRVISTGAHLANTFLLLLSLTVTAWWASGGEALSFRHQGALLTALVFGMVGVMILAISGAINALGDTLFPAASLAAGMQQDFAPGAHFLLQLRVWHPILALVTAFYLIFVTALVFMFRPTPIIRRFAGILMALFVLQLSAGLVNLILLAPVWMQLIHLLLADSVWITLVLLSATLFTKEAQPV